GLGRIPRRLPPLRRGAVAVPAHDPCRSGRARARAAGARPGRLGRPRTLRDLPVPGRTTPGRITAAAKPGMVCPFGARRSLGRPELTQVHAPDEGIHGYCHSSINFTIDPDGARALYLKYHTGSGAPR